MRRNGITTHYATRTISRPLDFTAVEQSLRQAGFERKTHDGPGIKFVRGAVVGSANYDGEGLQVQVFLTPQPDGRTLLEVGNRVFPFVPRKMKDRFTRLADRLSYDLSEQGVLHVRPDEKQEADEAKMETQGKLLVYVAIGAALLAVAYFLLG